MYYRYGASLLNMRSFLYTCIRNYILVITRYSMHVYYPSFCSWNSSSCSYNSSPWFEMKVRNQSMPHELTCPCLLYTIFLLFLHEWKNYILATILLLLCYLSFCSENFQVPDLRWNRKVQHHIEYEITCPLFSFLSDETLV